MADPVKPDLVIAKGKASTGQYVDVFVPGEDVDGVLADRQALSNIAAAPDGPPTPVMCDICGDPFLIPAAMAMVSTPQTRYYQMCPKHSQAEKMAFITSVREQDNE